MRDRPLQPGQDIDQRYLIERQVSQGMAEVWLVWDQDLNRHAIFKRLPAYDSRDKSKERFLQEITSHAKLQHPNICTVYDAKFVDNWIKNDRQSYLVVEFISGADLETILNKCRKEELFLSLGDVRRIFLDICHGLMAVHNAKLVHRDLKPNNICIGLFEGDQIVSKIIDFGIVKSVDEEKPARRHITGPEEEPQGTLSYMAPEQHDKSKAIGPWTDIWALGLILAELLLLDNPFRRLPIPHLLVEAAEKGERPRASKLSGFEAFFDKALHSEPTKRFSCVADMKNDFLRCFDQWKGEGRTGKEIELKELLETITREDPQQNLPKKLNEPSQSRNPPYGISAQQWWKYVLAIGVMIVLFAAGFFIAKKIHGPPSDSSPNTTTSTSAPAAPSASAPAAPSASAPAAPSASAPAAPSASAPAAPSASASAAASASASAAPSASASAAPSASASAAPRAKASAGPSTSASAASSAKASGGQSSESPPKPLSPAECYQEFNKNKNAGLLNVCLGKAKK